MEHAALGVDLGKDPAPAPGSKEAEFDFGSFLCAQGNRFEARVMEVIASRCSVVTVEPTGDGRADLARTLDLMSQGTDVIAQARVESARLGVGGYPDLIVREACLPTPYDLAASRLFEQVPPSPRPALHRLELGTPPPAIGTAATESDTRHHHHHRYCVMDIKFATISILSGSGREREPRVLQPAAVAVRTVPHRHARRPPPPHATAAASAPSASCSGGSRSEAS